MTLRDVLQEFLDLAEWEDEIHHDDSDNTDFVETEYKINGQTHTLQILTDENHHLMRITMVSPIAVPKPRLKEAAVVAIGLNNHMGYGSLGILDSGQFFWAWSVNIEGVPPVPNLFANMVRLAGGAFDTLRCTALGAAAFSKQSGEEILRDYYDAIAPRTD